ncbi:hypothetical protein O181_033880 [Austropuccinia psidii MF-1]|uniref:Reverse transcriptase/retrotransposon-derived protein RNase H-like domain-containing protein n=1 Tax=Austropuccinia psidii MF-1 TaxID=1389203 RepID=A0A9Q3D3U8_9BASI|nr:hypothetical protein [Austropuccinia psidii MF-1]
MRISLKKCNFGFEELNSLGNVVSESSLIIDKNKVSVVLLKPIPNNKKEIMSPLGFYSYYKQNLKEFEIVAKSPYRIFDQQTVFEKSKERIEAYEKIKKALTEEILILDSDWNIPFKLYIYACGDVLGAALHQVKIINDRATEGQFFNISRSIKPTEARYGESQMECFFWYWHLRNSTIILMEVLLK